VTTPTPTEAFPVIEDHGDHSVMLHARGDGSGRIHMTPEQLKDAALRLAMRTHTGDRLSRDAAMVASAYLDLIHEAGK
jgi:hypothetical protein